ncbi:uncharacterized protein LOC132713905 isoform X3 [Ruditapes philippinarum]|nr:uncharacterized protein LOC132713905 isoform X3 [Ruditapes philippinarum]
MNHYMYVVSLVVWCFTHLGNTQQLQDVPSKLSSLAVNLHYDRDIQTEINSLAHDGQEIVISFQNTLKTEGGKILTERNRLVKTSNPTDVKVDTLRTILKRARTSLQYEQKDIISLESDIHINIERCHTRRKQHDTSRKNVNIELESLPKKISSLEDKIRAHDESVRNIEQSSNELDVQAENLRRAARKKKKRGLFGGVIGGIVGVALAPFTGGASLAIATAAAGIHAGVNLNDADDCNRNARRLRDEANSKRQEAQRLRTERDTLVAEKNKLLSEIRKLETSMDELRDAESGLEAVSGYLRSSTEVITELLFAIENMDTAMKDADLHGNSFEIIQNAFARHPEKLDKSSQVHLNTLKDKWQRLAHILSQYGAKAALV